MIRHKAATGATADATSADAAVSGPAAVGPGRKTGTGPGCGREYDARREYETGTGATNMRGRNTAALVLAGLMTTTLIACSATSTRPSTGQMLDDSVVTAKVKAALIQDPVTKAHQINVETFK